MTHHDDDVVGGDVATASVSSSKACPLPLTLSPTTPPTVDEITSELLSTSDSVSSDTASADASASEECSPFGSRETSSVDLKALLVVDNENKSNINNVTTLSSSTTTATKKQVTLEERGKIPLGLYVVAGSILLAQYVGDVWQISTLLNWKESMVHATITSHESLLYLRNLLQTVSTSLLDTAMAVLKLTNDSDSAAPRSPTTTTTPVVDWNEVAYALIVTMLIGSTLYVLIGAPLRAGFWTGPRSSKHKIHRYMGMAFLLQYFAAWVEFVTNYDHAKDSYLPHFIAINGLIQGYSAYFSFKVLPDAHDPGYYSDKAVASRKFIHENIYFSWLTTWGSIYYHEGWRNKLQSHPIGQLLEVAFIFYPYILIRPLFPTTSFGAAGSGRKSRTTQNETFYHYGTLAIKFFYLWAKYFLGFFVTFLWMLHKTTDAETKFIKGMFTLNVGTISIAIFLHTLRFKGVLPPKLTFSIYLLQIYANFSAIPLAYDLFASHKMLCGTMFVGIIANMTRSRLVHFVWCSVMLYLIKFRTDIDW